MSLGDAFKKTFGESTTTELVEGQRIKGKIIKLSDRGWGFITSREIPFTRIFFHWQGLNHTTKNFADLQKNMTVEFQPVKREGKGYSAIKIQVLE